MAQENERAHLVALPPCAWPGCGSATAVVLVNGVNAAIREYCARHGEPALRAFKAGRL